MVQVRDIPYSGKSSRVLIFVAIAAPSETEKIIITKITYLEGECGFVSRSIVEN